MLKDDDKFRYIPLETLLKPRDEYTVKVDKWWLVDPNLGALVYKHGNSYMCNTHREIVERVRGDMRVDIVFIPLAFVPPRNSL